MKFAASLPTRVMGKHLEYYRLADSTNTLAARAARTGAPHGLVVVADEQSAGRGRRERTWVAPPCQGLLFSVLVRHTGWPPGRTGWLALAAGLAVAEALEEATGLRIQLKWPNDLVILDFGFSLLDSRSSELSSSRIYAGHPKSAGVQSPGAKWKERVQACSAIEPNPLPPSLEGKGRTERIRNTKIQNQKSKIQNGVPWRKLGGILCEGVLSSAPDVSGFTVVGVGLNVLQARRELPEVSKAPPTSLWLETRRKFSRQKLLARILPRMEARFEGLKHEAAFRNMRAAVEARLACWSQGQTLLAQSPEGIARGRYAGLDDWGRLRLETPGGVVAILADAEITSAK